MTEPRKYVHTWYSATVQGDREWQDALRHWERDLHRYDDPRRREAAIVNLTAARTRFREWILSWFWALCAPIGPGECVPTMVAELIAEDWDLRTRWPS